MEDNSQLPPEELDANKDLDKQEQQEQQEQKKEENKKTLKTVITSVICTLLFIIILLLLILLGLKKCMGPVPDIGDSSNNGNTSSQYVEIYDNKTLDNVFKKIVKEQRRIDTQDDVVDLIVPKDVIAVTCSENDNKFNLSITLTTEDNRMFFYSVNNCAYKEEVTGYDNLITYLLSNDEDQNHIFMGYGDIILDTANVTTAEVINTNKPNPHFATSMTPSSVKYISGYYYQDNKYYVYDRLEYTDQNNPLGNNEGTLVDDTSLLYGYYLRLSGVIV